MEGVDDLCVIDIDNGRSFDEEPTHVFAERLVLSLLDLRQIHPIAVTAKRADKVAGKALFELFLVVNGASFEIFEPREGRMLHAEREVDALGIIIAFCIGNRHGIAA